MKKLVKSLSMLLAVAGGLMVVSCVAYRFDGGEWESVRISKKEPVGEEELPAVPEVLHACSGGVQTTDELFGDVAVGEKDAVAEPVAANAAEAAGVDATAASGSKAPLILEQWESVPVGDAEPVCAATGSEAREACSDADIEFDPNTGDADGVAVGWLSAEHPELTTHFVIQYDQKGNDVLEDAGGNAQEIARMDRLFAYVRNTGDRVTGLKIKGYTSIEGTYDNNHTLSMERACRLKWWMIERYDLPIDLDYSIFALGEDWKGLRERVAGSGMPGEQEVLDIMDNVGIFQGREKQLMDLQGGDPYRYMMGTMFGGLRRVEVDVEVK